MGYLGHIQEEDNEKDYLVIKDQEPHMMNSELREHIKRTHVPGTENPLHDAILNLEEERNKEIRELYRKHLLAITSRSLYFSDTPHSEDQQFHDFELLHQDTYLGQDVSLEKNENIVKVFSHESQFHKYYLLEDGHIKPIFYPKNTKHTFSFKGNVYFMNADHYILHILGKDHTFSTHLNGILRENTVRGITGNNEVCAIVTDKNLFVFDTDYTETAYELPEKINGECILSISRNTLYLKNEDTLHIFCMATKTWLHTHITDKHPRDLDSCMVGKYLATTRATKEGRELFLIDGETKTEKAFCTFTEEDMFQNIYPLTEHHILVHTLDQLCIVNVEKESIPLIVKKEQLLSHVFPAENGSFWTFSEYGELEKWGIPESTDR